MRKVYFFSHFFLSNNILNFTSKNDTTNMKSIYIKEINSFLSGLAGYIVFIVFGLAAGLFLWVLPDTNFMDYGYASMELYFEFIPWLLLFLIPAITMRSFAEEFNKGTIEWLATKPISNIQIILGKYLSSLTLVVIALLPTLIYAFSIHYLALDSNSLDGGALLASFLSLLFLVGSFTAIGVFCSTLATNQIVSFLLALFLCFIFYAGFDSFSRIPGVRGGLDYYLGLFGIEYHYNTMITGLVSLRDVLYFLALIFLFLMATRFSLTWKFLKS